MHFILFINNYSSIKSVAWLIEMFFFCGIKFVQFFFCKQHCDWFRIGDKGMLNRRRIVQPRSNNAVQFNNENVKVGQIVYEEWKLPSKYLLDFFFLPQIVKLIRQVRPLQVDKVNQHIILFRVEAMLTTRVPHENNRIST